MRTNNQYIGYNKKDVNELINRAKLDIEAYKNGYPNGYTQDTIVGIYKLRQELCEAKVFAADIKKEEIDKLIDIIDKDETINNKKFKQKSNKHLVFLIRASSFLCQWLNILSIFQIF